MSVLTDQEQADLAEVTRLLDEAYQHYFDNSDGHCKSSEGYVHVDFGNTFQRRADDRRREVEVYSYVFGPGRSHFFNSPADALAAVRDWHATEMQRDHSEEGW